MEKFDSRKHNNLTKKLPFSYVSLPIYLDFCAYVFERNGEDVIVTQDPCYLHDFPALFLPENSKNWTRASMSMLTKENVSKIEKENIEIADKNPTETEYFYKTEDFINPKGKLKSRINQFSNNYKFEIKSSYPKEKIKEFYLSWEKQKEREDDLFEKESTDLFFFCLDNLDRFDVKQVYIEVDGKLAGLAWGVSHFGNNWVGLHLKADYKYKGLSRFLQYERAKMFSGGDFFSLGTGCNDPGLVQFKKELGPIQEKQYYYVFTREKIKQVYGCHV